MTAEQLLITKPNMKDLQRTVHDLIAVHNKLVYHVFNSPNDKVIECTIEPSLTVVYKDETAKLASRFYDTPASLIECLHDFDATTLLCKHCHKPYEDGEDD